MIRPEFVECGEFPGTLARLQRYCFMHDFQREFIELALRVGVLRFGEFVLKSGRRSPYFFNTGLFDSGASLAKLADAYAAAIDASAIEMDMLYGPAYKGIPLVAAVATRMYARSGLDIPYCFNRKEAKDHGEGGRTVGAPLKGRVLIIDDVISAGTSVRESLEVIGEAGAQPVGVAISLDRQERGAGARSAIAEVEEDLGLEVVSIVQLDHIVEFLTEKGQNQQTLAAVNDYRSQYGT